MDRYETFTVCLTVSFLIYLFIHLTLAGITSIQTDVYHNYQFDKDIQKIVYHYHLFDIMVIWFGIVVITIVIVVGRAFLKND